MIKRIRINNQITATELRVVTVDGENLGVISTSDAQQRADDMGMDLIEISPHAKPPVAKIMDYGKYLYDEKKKDKAAKAGAKNVEVKTVQVKIGTGEHDLELKAKQTSKWLGEGHRVKIDLYLRGRAKYMEKGFLEGRLDRMMKYITEQYSVVDPVKKSPKGLTIIIGTIKK